MKRMMMLMALLAVGVGLTVLAALAADYKCPICGFDMYSTGQTRSEWGKLLILYKCPAGHAYWFPYGTHSIQSGQSNYPNRSRISQMFQDFSNNWTEAQRLRMETEEHEKQLQIMQTQIEAMQQREDPRPQQTIQEKSEMGNNPFAPIPWLPTELSQPQQDEHLSRPNILECPYCKLKCIFTGETRMDGKILQYIYKCLDGHVSIWSCGW